MDGVVHEHHADRRRRRRQRRQRREQRIDHRVDDAAFGKDHRDGASDANEHGGKRHVPEPLHERVGGAVHAQPADQAGQNPHHDEHGGQFVKPPAKSDQAGDEDAERHHHQPHDHRGAPAAEGGCPRVGSGLSLSLSSLTLRLYVVSGLSLVLYVASGFSRTRSDLRRVPHRVQHPHGERRQQHGRAERRAREQLHLRKLLCDADLEWIHRAERRADGGRPDADGDGGDVVEAQSPGQQHQHRDERDDLLLHVLQYPAGGEERGTDRDRQHAAAAERQDQARQRHAERAGTVDDHERGAAEQDDGDDRDRLGDAFRYRQRDRQRAERVGRDRMKRPGDDDHPSRRRIFPAVVFAGGDDVGQRGGDENAADEQGERVREARASHRA